MTTISSYEASKIAFTEVFVKRNHIETQVGYPSHNTTLSNSVAEKETAWRLATDIQFLSILEHQGRLNGEVHLAELVLEHLNLALTKLEEQLKQETFYLNLFSPYTAQNLIAFTFVKKYNINALEYKYDSMATSIVETYLPLFLRSAVDSYKETTVTWEPTLFGDGSGTLTYEELTEEKRHIVAPNGIKRFAGSLNVYSIMGGALGLYGALLSEVPPNRYEYRNEIVELGKLAISMSDSGNRSIGHLNNIGGGRKDGGFISTGYASWVARGLAQMGTGTTFELNHPKSMFMDEAQQIKQGLLTVLSRKGYMPDVFVDFYGRNSFNTRDVDLETDKTIYLYELAWCGDQVAMDTIESHLATKHGLGKEHPIIIDSLLSDENSVLGSNAHRALAGLTAGMIKSLYFNYGDM
ncbi:hypothetical protein [Neobacillus sp. D3-1R]|uniref:hypothetical protein n=1 Tax=Neobacillus sp. D3-1R TaxID=3445778 RepID=UPI003F9F97FC